MSHNKHIIDGINKDLIYPYDSKESYLKLTEGFRSNLPDPIILNHDGVDVVREDIDLIGGSKTRAAEFLFSKLKRKTVVYVVPRYGFAGIAIMELCKMYNKEAIFFMPSSKIVSDHQYKVISMKPKDIIFKRIAAMPNLNLIAKKFAIKNDFEFLPFGLNHPYTIAGIVRSCETILKNHKEPEEIWSVVSTGVLTRGIQIGFSNSKMKGVAVARNMKAGELGRTEVISEKLPFHTSEKIENLPEFPTVASYDGKAWKYIPKNTNRNILFWNVAKDIEKQDKTEKVNINSYRDWDKNETNK
jgi:hypothetical protein